MSEQALARFLATRLSEDLAEVMARTHTVLLRKANAMLQNHTFAEDVLAELYRRLAQLELKGERLIKNEDAFLTSILVQIARSYIRELARRRARDQKFRAASGASGSHDPSLDTVVDVHSAVLELPLELREVVDLHFFGGLSMAEVAAHVGITRQSAHERRQKACAILKARLGAPALAVIPGFSRKADAASGEGAATPSLRAKLEGICRSLRTASKPAAASGFVAWLASLRAILPISVASLIVGGVAIVGWVAARSAPAKAVVLDRQDLPISREHLPAPVARAPTATASSAVPSKAAPPAATPELPASKRVAFRLVGPDGELLTVGKATFRSSIEDVADPLRVAERSLVEMYPWTFTERELVEGNPVVIEDVPRELWGKRLEVLVRSEEIEPVGVPAAIPADLGDTAEVELPGRQGGIGIGPENQGIDPGSDGLSEIDRTLETADRRTGDREDETPSKNVATAEDEEPTPAVDPIPEKDEAGDEASAGGRPSIVVLDSKTDRPIRDAEVHAEPLRTASSIVKGDRVILVPTVCIGKTNNRGRLDVARTPVEHSVQVRVKGYRTPEPRRLVLDREHIFRLDPLPPAALGEIVLRVLDPAGQPWAGAEVELLLRLGLDGERTAAADTHGVARFRGVSPGLHSVGVSLLSVKNRRWGRDLSRYHPPEKVQLTPGETARVTLGAK